MRILAFGTYDVRTHPRVGVLIEGLREHGDEVVEVNRPLGIGTAARVDMLRRPWRLPLLALRLVHRWSALAVRGRLAARAFRPDAVLVGYLGHFDVRLARLLFPRTPIVLDHLIFAADTAADRGLRGGWRARLLGRLDRGALRSADVVVLDTGEHLAMMPADLAGRGVVVPVGAPAAWFRAGATRSQDDGGDGQDRRPLRVVFFGLFTPLQGTPVLAAAVSMLAHRDDVEVLLVGRGQDSEEVRAAVADNPRVAWREWVPADELPGLVASYDVCLGIFGTGPKALRVIPNKVYQGAAAGCAVVTSDTAPQRAALGDTATLVPPGDAASLAKALCELADDRRLLDERRRAARARAEAAFTPTAVVAPLRTFLAALLSGGSSAGGGRHR